MANTLYLWLALVAALAAPAASQTATPTATGVDARDWGSMARQDVQAAYDLYVANHPGMHDPLNPDFPERLLRARDAGLAAAGKATSRAHYAEALGAFSAELMDGHAMAFAKDVQSSTPPKYEWPRFVAAWRGDKMLVHHAVVGSPAPIGVEIVSCDGLTMRELVIKRLGFRGFRPGEAGHWWMRGGRAFYSTPGYSDHRPKRCTFRTPQGQEFTADLPFTEAPDGFSKLFERGGDGERTPIGLTEPRKGIFLVGMPTFSPSADEVKAYRALFDTLSKRRTELTKAKAVVIDLRYNNGGSSAWSRDAGRILWGQDALDQRMDKYFKNVRIWWRASPDNVAYMSELEAKLRKDGQDRIADTIGQTGAGMRESLAKGEPFFVQGEEKDARTYPSEMPPTDFMTPVYVITPGRCASACLDAIDTFKQFSNVKLIGAPTSGDSTYMEARTMDLPSGEGRIVIPIKVWMKRPRGSGEVYTPDILVTDLDWSTRTFLDKVEADLAN